MMQEFLQAMRETTEQQIGEIHTAIPGKILQFDPATGLATVLPHGKFIQDDGTTLDYPKIYGVPVLFPQSYNQRATIAFPIRENDGCLLIVSEQSIEGWLYSQDTELDNAFDLSDAICIPGLWNRANETVAEACADQAIVLQMGDTKLKLGRKKVTISAKTIDITGSDAVNIRGGKINLN